MFHVLKTTLNLSFTKMHSTQHHCFLGKAVRNIKTSKSQFGKKIHVTYVRTKGYSTDLLDPTQVESKKCSQIQWPVPSINAEPVDIFLGEE